MYKIFIFSDSSERSELYFLHQLSLIDSPDFLAENKLNSADFLAKNTSWTKQITY